MSSDNAAQYLYTWNAPPHESVPDVQVEDDCRDALQAAYASRPSLPQRKALLNLEAKIGVQYVFLGFPATSKREQEECAALLKHVGEAGLQVTPVLMSRAVLSDLDAIQAIASEARTKVLVDIFVCLSPLRQQIEGWSPERLVVQMQQVASRAEAGGLRYRVAYEDSTRTPPHVLLNALVEATKLCPEQIVLNDTVGDSTPSGVAHHVKFAADVLADTECEAALAWHGHNDKGLALANAMAAIEAGARVISGTFLGIGERSGNIPLEQLIYLLIEGGSKHYNPTHLLAMCELFAQSTNSDISRHQPIVGHQCFSTATGTHAAAVLKAQRIAPEFADYAFSAVPAHKLGRRQEILLGPNSGRAAVRAFLEQQALPASEGIVAAVLAHCHGRNAVADPKELQELVRSLG